MRKLKVKIFSFILVLLMIFGECSTTFAAEKDNVNSNIYGTYEIEVPISAEDSTISCAPYKLLTGDVSVSLVRNGNSTAVQVYLNWSGEYSINAFRFKQLEVQSSSFFSSEPYGTVGNGKSYKTYNATGSTVASRYITTLTIPEDVKQAKVTVSDLQVYAMVKGSWISGLLASKNIKIR